MDGNTSQKSSVQNQEQQWMKRDLIKALVVNTIFLAILIGLFFLNRTSGFLEKFIARF